jgi:D-amino-acid dehydrogenase
MSRHIVVIGAGIVGAASALALLEDGNRVTILDPGPPGGTQAASYGNGCWISPGSIIPMSMPGLWKKIPGYLTDPLGPLTIRWQALPQLLPWLIRFVLAGATVAKVERTARNLAGLLRDGPARHRRLAATAGVGELIEQTGLLYLYPSRADFEAEALAWRLRRDNGLTWTELDENELRQTEPDLDRRYRFAIRLDAGGHCRDPGAYVGALVAHAQAMGAAFVHARATGFHIEAGRLRGVQSSNGTIPCDGAVIAAGIASAALARAAE